MLGYPRLVTSPPPHQFGQSGHRHMPSAQYPNTAYVNVPEGRLPAASRANPHQLQPPALRANSPDQPFSGLMKTVQGQERPTYISVDVTRKSEYSQSDGLHAVSILQDTSNPQLHQSIHTTVLNQSHSQKNASVGQKETLYRQRQRLRRERQEFQRQQELARKEQHAIRLEQQQIRREQESIRREQQQQKERHNVSKDKHSSNSINHQRSEAQSIPTHSQPPFQPEFILDGSRLTRQTPSRDGSQPDGARQQLVRRLRMRVEELQQITQRQSQQITETIATAQRRQKHLSENYQSYIQQLRNQKLQLLDLNKTSQQDINKLRVEVERAHKTSSQHYSSQVERLQAALISKQKQIQALNATTSKLQAALALNKGEQFDSNLKLINFEKRVHMLQSEIEKYTESIKAKNLEILELKNVQFKGDKQTSLNRHIEATSREVERLNQLLLSKTSEVSQYRNQLSQFQMKLAKAMHRNDSLQEEKEAEVNRLKGQLESKDFEYTRIRQSLLLKESQIKQLLAGRDQTRQRLLALEEEVDKSRTQNKYLISQLQYKNGQLEKRSRQLEGELKQARKALSSLQSNKINAVKEDQLKTLQARLGDLTSLMERDRGDQNRTRRQSDQTLLTLERLKVEQQLKIQQLGWELSRKEQQLTRLTQQNQQLNTVNTEYKSKQEQLLQNIQTLSLQLSQTEQQLTACRIELDRKVAETTSHEVKFNMYKQLYQQASSTMIRKDSQDKHNFSPFARSGSGKGTPSRLPQESNTKYRREDSRDKRERHTANNPLPVVSPATRLRSPDMPLKGEQELQRNNKYLLGEVERLNDTCRQYEHMLSKCNSSRFSNRDLQLVKVTSRHTVSGESSIKVEQLKERLTRYQSDAQMLKTQLTKQQDLLRTVESQSNLQKMQLELQLRSLRLQLDEQTKQRTFYEQETLKCQLRIEQLSAQLTASIVQMPPPSLLMAEKDTAAPATNHLRQTLHQANNKIEQLASQKDQLLMELRKLQDENGLLRKNSQKDISTIGSTSVLRVEPDHQQLVAQVYETGQHSHGLHRQLQQALLENRSHRSTVFNVINKVKQIYSTFVMFMERLRAICYQLKTLFSTAGQQVPTPLNDLLTILEEILQWTLEQQHHYSETRPPHQQ